MKYRILTHEELSHLEEDLKHFLIVHGVHGDEWQRINQEEPSKAVQLVEIFSDTVLQKVYEKLGYLEFRSEQTCMVFKFGQNEVQLISIQRKQGSLIDLSTPESIHEALKKSLADLDFFYSKKEYSASREAEIYQMLEQGCLLSSQEFWDLLIQLIK